MNPPSATHLPPSGWQTFRQQIACLAQLEFRAYWHHRKLMWAALVVVLIPSIYLLIYLSSV
jgi:hypothetical protein